MNASVLFKAYYQVFDAVIRFVILRSLIVCTVWLMIWFCLSAARALRGAKAKTNFGLDSVPKPAASSTLPMAYLPWRGSKLDFHPTGSATVLHVNLGKEGRSRASEFMSCPPLKGVSILQGLGLNEVINNCETSSNLSIVWTGATEGHVRVRTQSQHSAVSSTSSLLYLSKLQVLFWGVKRILFIMRENTIHHADRVCQVRSEACLDSNFDHELPLCEWF